MTGAPESSALRIIEALETAPRGPYCGGIGWVGADHTRNRTAGIPAVTHALRIGYDQMGVRPDGRAADRVDPAEGQPEGRLRLSRLRPARGRAPQQGRVLREGQRALRNCRLTVQVSTKLNRSHAVCGREALIPPTLGRTERDRGPDGVERFVTVEDSRGWCTLLGAGCHPPPRTCSPSR